MTTLEGGTIGGPEFPLWVPNDDTPLIPLQAMFIAAQQSVLDALTGLRGRMQSVQVVTHSSATPVFDDASGWSNQNAYVHIMGERYCYFFAQLKKTGSNLSVPSDGNINNLTLGQLSEKYWPRSESGLSSGDAGRLVAAYANAAGEVRLTALNSGNDLLVNQNITVVGGWILQDPIPST